MLGSVEHPWFDPLWRRIALVAFCAAWTGLEYFFENITWVYIMVAITVYAAWAFLLSYRSPDDPARKDRTDQEEE